MLGCISPPDVCAGCIASSAAPYRQRAQETARRRCVPQRLGLAAAACLLRQLLPSHGLFWSPPSLQRALQGRHCRAVPLKPPERDHGGAWIRGTHTGAAPRRLGAPTRVAQQLVDMHMYGSRKVFPLGPLHRTQLKSKVHLNECLPICSYRDFRFFLPIHRAHRLHTLPLASVSARWAAAGPRITGPPHLLNLVLVCNCTPPL